VNGNELSGQTLETLNYDKLENEDVVTCALTTTEQCVIDAQVMSNGIIANVDDCSLTSTWTMINNEQIEVVPNPSNGQFQIQVQDLKGVFNIDILDLTGRILTTQSVIFNQDKERISMDLSKSGVYFIKIYNTEKLNIQKIMINQ